MDADAKKTALRMIPYGLYVLTAEKDGEIAAATVNWFEGSGTGDFFARFSKMRK